MTACQRETARLVLDQVIKDTGSAVFVFATEGAEIFPLYEGLLDLIATFQQQHAAAADLAQRWKRAYPIAMVYGLAEELERALGVERL